MPLAYRLVKIAFLLLAPLLTRSRLVTGIENVPSTGPAILAGNHISYWDPTTLLTYVARPVRFLSKAEMFEVPVLGWIFRRLRVVGLERDSPDIGAMREAIRLLGEGEIVALYPQGSRAPIPGGGSHTPKGGVLLLAERSGAPIVPVGIAGMERLFRGRPQVTVTFGSPFVFDDLVREAGGKRDRGSLLPHLMRRIEHLIEPAGSNKT